MPNIDLQFSVPIWRNPEIGGTDEYSANACAGTPATSASWCIQAVVEQVEFAAKRQTRQFGERAMSSSAFHWESDLRDCSGL